MNRKKQNKNPCKILALGKMCSTEVMCRREGDGPVLDMSPAATAVGEKTIKSSKSYSKGKTHNPHYGWG